MIIKISIILIKTVMTKYLKILSCHYYVSILVGTICQPEALVLPSWVKPYLMNGLVNRQLPYPESQLHTLNMKHFNLYYCTTNLMMWLLFYKNCRCYSEQRLIQRDTVALRHNLSQTVLKSIIANIENFKFFKDDQLI